MDNKKTINYITYDSWWDTDKTIIPLLSNKYDVKVIVLDPIANDTKYPNKESHGANCLYRFKQHYRDRNPLSILVAFRIIIKILRLSDGNSINIFVPGKNPYLLLFFYMMINPSNTYICYHNYLEHIDKRKTLVAKFKKLFLTKYKRFIFYSNSQKKLFDIDFPNKKSYLFKMPIKDFGLPTKKRRNNKITFLFFGLIRDYKRLDLFIKAANLLDKGKCNFIIAGKSSNWDFYSKMIKNPDDFCCDIKFIDNVDVPNYFCNSDFLVLPYDDTTQSGPLMIALNYNLPVIAANLIEFSNHIVDGVNGYLFDVGSLESLTYKMKTASNLSVEQLAAMKESQCKVKDIYIKETKEFEL